MNQYKDDNTLITFSKVVREHGQVFATDDSIRTSKKSLDTIIEVLDYYSNTIEGFIDKADNAKTRAMLIIKKKECEKIRDSFIEQTGYCKECKKAKEDDIGMDAMEAALLEFNK